MVKIAFRMILSIEKSEKDRRQKTEDGKQRTEGGRQKTEGGG